ncbi:MAG TPA: hypothetical protein VL096_16930, partial [Pirellulaceae bacterium]|nr:hypothetical protein [Pirellulaceae bacterium]
MQSYVPAAQLVEARILRRVIRLDRRLPGFGLSVLRRQSYTIERERLLTFVDRTELDLSSIEDLPRNVILLARPSDDELQSPAGVERVLKRYARLLLHECVHVELDQPSIDEASRSGWAQERRRELGELEFAEIRAVLQKEELLFPAPTDVETYIEFVATYLELRYFAEAAVPRYFPAIRDWRAVDRIVSQDLDHAALFAKLEFLSTPDLEAIAAEQVSPATQANQRWATTPRITLADFRRLQARAERAAAIGNRVNAAIVHTRAAHLAPLEYAAEAHAAAHGEIVQVAQRLQQVLSKTAVPAEVWAAALQPLLAPAAVGFWANEARLLYDLQKVCIEHERGVYRLDLVEWVRTMGTRPIRRPLPLLRDALMIRHLRTALRRVTKACIDHADREALTVLLSQAVEQIEHESRDQLRPIVAGVLENVGLVPQNVPERVAQHKLIEELLDRVVERSYVSMADLRDALSKNELKLPDVATVADLAQGDRLLRADRKFDTALDGVYRRGAIYQRWPQTISSLAFGTELGRFLTKYLALPYGGAYLALAFVHHVVLMIAGDGHHTPELTPPELAPHDAAAHAVGPMFYVGVIALGTWLLALLHVPSFREWTIAVLTAGWRMARQVAIDWPAKLLHSQIVQQILNSQAFAALR